MEALIPTLQDALAQGDIIVIVAAALAVAIVAGLKLAGKSIPLLDSLLPAAVRALAALRKKPDAAPPPPPEAPVVRIEDARALRDGAFGQVTPEVVAKFDKAMQDAGYIKEPDGSWRRIKPMRGDE